MVSHPKVLAVGVLLNDQPNLALEISQALQASNNFDVEVRWASLGPNDIKGELDDYVVIRQPNQTDKFSLVNALLEDVNLDRFDWIIVVDDDVHLPDKWIDLYLQIQSICNFDVCQPARTAASFISHPFTTAQPGIDARRTAFVEIGPVFSIHKSAFDSLLPFNEEWPMGWGMESEWSDTCRLNGFRMGIIDAHPIGNTFRTTTATYDYESTEQKMRSMLATKGFPPVESLHYVHEVYVDENMQDLPDTRTETPQLSVVISTRDRPEYVARVLQSLQNQSIRQGLFEVVVVDDGSLHRLDDVVGPFRRVMDVRLVRERASGIGAARNLGLFVAKGHIVLFIDDDDWVRPDSLSVILAAHHHWSELGDAVLGLTTLDDHLKTDFLMQHTTSSGGGELFNYASFAADSELSWKEFWGGRVSVKREFLMRNGLFDTHFEFGAEDLELAWRLRPHGLRVFYAPLIEHVLFRKIGLEQLLERSEKQGLGLARFYRLVQNDEVLQTTAYDPRLDLNIDVAALKHVAQTGIAVAENFASLGFGLGETFVNVLNAAIRLLCADAFQQGYRSGGSSKEAEALSHGPEDIVHLAP